MVEETAPGLGRYIVDILESRCCGQPGRDQRCGSSLSARVKEPRQHDLAVRNLHVRVHKYVRMPLRPSLLLELHPSVGLEQNFLSAVPSAIRAKTNHKYQWVIQTTCALDLETEYNLLQSIYLHTARSSNEWRRNLPSIIMVDDQNVCLALTAIS